MTVSKPWLTAWAAKLAAEFAADQLPLLNQTMTAAGREAVVGLVKGAAQGKRDEASDRGTFVHDIVEALILDAPLPAISDEVAPYADAFVDWVVAWQPRFLAAEATVANPGDGWAGTLDIVAYLPSLGSTFTIDVKTGKNLDHDMPIQLGTYQRATEVWLPFGRKAPMPETQGTAILHLRPGRARFMDVTENATDEAYGEFLDRLALLRNYDSRPKTIGTVRYPLQADGTPGSPWLEDLTGVPLVDLLAQHGIVTIADLSSQSAADLASVKGIGPKRIDSYRGLLATHGMTLVGDTTQAVA